MGRECNRCKEEKPLDAFYMRKGRYATRCKACETERRKRKRQHRRSLDRRCSRCDQIKSAHAFEGLRRICRSCRNEDARNVRQQEEQKKTRSGLASSGGYCHNSRLHELLDTVDAFQGEPTEEDIQRIAKEFSDTEFFVKHCFQYKEHRLARIDS